MDVLNELGLQSENPGAYAGEWIETSGDLLASINPATGAVIASVREASAQDYARVSDAAHEAFLRWRQVPGPQRGEYVRRIAQVFREHKEALGQLVTMEMGKIIEEGRGEVQECIDIADFAVGLSRQLYGLTIQSERPEHSMRETWHPLGTVSRGRGAFITAQNCALPANLAAVVCEGFRTGGPPGAPRRFSRSSGRHKTEKTGKQNRGKKSPQNRKADKKRG